MPASVGTDQMKKSRKILLTVILLCIVPVFLYLAVSWYYSRGFSINTWINGVYCTGKTIDAVNSELLEKTKAPSIIIMDRDGRRFTVTPADIGLEEDYTSALEAHLETQYSLLWITRCGDDSKTFLKPQFTYDEQMLMAFWDALPFVKEERDMQAQVSIELSDEGYQLKNTTIERLNEEKAYDLLRGELMNMSQWYDPMDDEKDHLTEYVIDLKKAGVYEDSILSAEQKDIIVQWEKVQSVLKVEIVYDMGDEQISLKASDISQFLERGEDGSFKTEEDGRLYLSKQKVNDFIDTLADEYDTYKKERTFQSTRGDIITIKKGSYGTLIDRDKEKEYLYKALTNKVSEVHIPVYKRSAYHRGKNDIGDTYIEIDMTEQKMYLYLKGECLVETAIVTGCTAKHMGTPEGIYSVYSMQRNRTLKGADYEAKVTYWMPVNGNIGIHDAGWRKSFGGEIYKKSGSHGCINTPYEAMKQIYENVEVGIPVVVFH